MSGGRLGCDGYKGDGMFCHAPVVWRAAWSDRVAYVCEEHKPQVQEWHDGDHKSDQMGIEWEGPLR